jgi:PAS domain-containing protein
MRRADGAIIWVRDTTHVKRAPDGKVLLYEGVLEDITWRVEAEQAVQANERRLTQILEVVPIGILVSDEMGSPVFMNAAAKKTLGNGLADTGIDRIAETYKAFLAGTDEVYPLDRNPLAKALKGVAASVDDVEIRQNGRVVSLSVQGVPILDSQGRVIAAVVAFIDTSDRRVLESQLRQTSKMEAVGRLAGGSPRLNNSHRDASYGAMLLDRLDVSDPITRTCGRSLRGRPRGGSHSTAAFSASG